MLENINIFVYIYVMKNVNYTLFQTPDLWHCHRLAILAGAVRRNTLGTLQQQNPPTVFAAPPVRQIVRKRKSTQ